jgi:hypothetical protein
MPSRRTLLSEHVFINCPFDHRYKPIFEGIVFAVSDLGFVAPPKRLQPRNNPGSKGRKSKGS